MKVNAIAVGGGMTDMRVMVESGFDSGNGKASDKVCLYLDVDDPDYYQYAAWMTKAETKRLIKILQAHLASVSK